MLAREVRELRTGRSWCCVPTGADRHRRACERGGGSGAARRAKRPAGQPRASSLAASSHRCISSISSTHWTMTRPASGGTSSSRAPRRTLMSMHRMMALSMICGFSRLLRGGVGGERRRLPPGRHPPPRFRPASSSRQRGTHARRSSPSVPVTETARRRPRSLPRRRHWCEGRAERVRRHRGHASQLGGPAPGGTGAARGGGRLRARRARRAGGARPRRGGAGARSRQCDAGAADGRRERPERPARGGGVRRERGPRRSAPSLPAGCRKRPIASPAACRPVGRSGSDGALSRPGAQQRQG